MNARPTKKEKDRATRIIHFRCTEEEESLLRRLADHYGYRNLSDYVRRASMGLQQVDPNIVKEEKRD